MFTKNKNESPTIQGLQDDLVTTLGELVIQEDLATYDEVLSRLERVNKMLPEKKERRISPDAIVAALTSLGGILIIIGYEHGHVIASKALGFVAKAK